MELNGKDLDYERYSFLLKCKSNVIKALLIFLYIIEQKGGKKMFVVYKITNLIENKCYIGSSVRVEKRWQQHINTSNNPNSSQYNYPLYEAFRQFGIKNFIFEIIADDFETIWEMEEYEQQMIDFYNSVKPNGYNQT